MNGVILLVLFLGFIVGIITIINLASIAFSSSKDHDKLADRFMGTCLVISVFFIIVFIVGLLY